VPWTEEAKQAFLRMQGEAQDADYRRKWPDARYLVVEVDGEPVGRLYRRDIVDEDPPELRLMDIALLPQWRNRGIGSALLDALLAEATARGLTVTLHVERWNPARTLYERLGFVDRGEDDVYGRMEWCPPGVAEG
jgi:ribosomal protein S18 acetylase RimI-like enzyme